MNIEVLNASHLNPLYVQLGKMHSFTYALLIILAYFKTHEFGFCQCLSLTGSWKLQHGRYKKILYKIEGNIDIFTLTLYYRLSNQWIYIKILRNNKIQPLQLRKHTYHEVHLFLQCNPLNFPSQCCRLHSVALPHSPMPQIPML